MTEEQAAVVIARCVSCGAKRAIKAGEIPADDVPMCDKCFMPMVAERAEARKETKKR